MAEAPASWNCNPPASPGRLSLQRFLAPSWTARGRSSPGRRYADVGQPLLLPPRAWQGRPAMCASLFLSLPACASGPIVVGFGDDVNPKQPRAKHTAAKGSGKTRHPRAGEARAALRLWNAQRPGLERPGAGTPCTIGAAAGSLQKRRVTVNPIVRGCTVSSAFGSCVELIAETSARLLVKLRANATTLHWSFSTPSRRFTSV